MKKTPLLRGTLDTDSCLRQQEEEDAENKRLELPFYLFFFFFKYHPITNCRVCVGDKHTRRGKGKLATKLEWSRWTERLASPANISKLEKDKSGDTAEEEEDKPRGRRQDKSRHVTVSTRRFHRNSM